MSQSNNRYFELMREFHRIALQYAVVGGMALLFHGIGRLTLDLDIVVEFSEKNIQKLLHAVKKFGLSPRVPVEPQQLLSADKREQWRRAKNMRAFTFLDPNNPLIVMDVLLDEQLENVDCQIFQLKDFSIPVISVRDLIRMKKMSGRTQDIADVEALEKLLYGAD